MVANHAHLATQRTLYVEVSLARHRGELAIDDREPLREQLEAATGERNAAHEAIEPERSRIGAVVPELGRAGGDKAETSPPGQKRAQEMDRSREPRGIGMEI